MNTLSTLRRDARALIEGAGVRAVDHLAERPNPPVAIVTPGSPYVQRGETFGSFTVTLTVVLLTMTATNAQETDTLDDMIARLVIAVHGSDFQLGDVDQPQSFQVNNATYRGTTVDLTWRGPLEVDG